MGFPYIFESNFECGSDAEWDGAETDTETLLDYPNFRELARHGHEPYSGAYCARIAATVASTANAVLTESSCDIVDTATSYFRFNVFFAKDFACTATDVCPILELQGAGNAETVACGFQITITTNVILLGIGAAANNAVPDTFAPTPIERGRWYTVELCVHINTGAIGTVNMYVTPHGGRTGAAADAGVDTITNIAVTHAVLGLQDQLATTTGTILLDNFVQDEARLYKPNRYPEEVVLTKTAHAFVGSGQIETLTYMDPGGAGSVMVYDSDSAETVDLVAVVASTAAGETVTRVTPINVSRGAHCVLAGQGYPRALAKLKYAPHSAAAVRDVGSTPR